MSSESSIENERLMNTEVQRRLGGTHSAGDAARLEAAGADLIVSCTNTMHRLDPAIEAAIAVPFLHEGVIAGCAEIELLVTP